MRASRISGLEDDNVVRQFTGSYLLKTNFYKSTIGVFNLDIPNPAASSSHIFYNYFLRDLSLASLELLAGLVLTVWGCLFGGFTWWNAVEQNISTPAGTAMLAGTMIIVGLQLLLGFFAYDMGDAPTHPLHLLYDDEAQPPAGTNGEDSQ